VSLQRGQPTQATFKDLLPGGRAEGISICINLNLGKAGADACGFDRVLWISTRAT
jgi:hypothetical protein